MANCGMQVKMHQQGKIYPWLIYHLCVSEVIVAKRQYRRYDFAYDAIHPPYLRQT